MVSKDSIFDRVLREEEVRLKGMGMGERDGSGGGGRESVKKDKMRGGRRVEI